MEQAAPIINSKIANDITDLPIAWQQRVEFLLVAVSEIPACTISLTSARSKWTKDQTLESVENVFKQIITSTHLHYVSGGEEDKRQYRRAIAGSAEVAQQILDANAFPNDDLQYGRLSGYPDTAVSTYAAYTALSAKMPEHIKWMSMPDGPQRTEAGLQMIKPSLKLQKQSGILDQYALPKEIMDDEAQPFISFRMTEAHWRDEMEYPRRWARLVKELAPRLYAQRK